MSGFTGEGYCDGSAMPDQALDDARYVARFVTTQRATLSDRALELINGPRADSYAAPEINLARIGVMWAPILGLDDAVPAWRVALALAALKIARAAHRPDEDSVVDAVGYLELVERLRDA